MNKKTILKQQKQKEAIILCIENWGVPVSKNRRGLGINHLCGDINNSWNAPLFTNKLCQEDYITCKMEICKHAFEYHDTDRLRRGILKAARRESCFEVKKISYDYFIYYKTKKVKK